MRARRPMCTAMDDFGGYRVTEAVCEVMDAVSDDAVSDDAGLGGGGGGGGAGGGGAAGGAGGSGARGGWSWWLVVIRCGLVVVMCCGFVFLLGAKDALGVMSAAGPDRPSPPSLVIAPMIDRPTE